MKYAGMPFGMWLLFSRSFRQKTETVLGYDTKTAEAIKKNAKKSQSSPIFNTLFPLFVKWR